MPQILSSRVLVLCLTALALVLAACAALAMNSRPAPEDVRAAAEASRDVDVLTRTMKRLDGQPQDLAEYRGKVILIVNTASKCGLTGQYAGLQKLYEDKQGEGFVVLGFPANNFMGQEPGSNEEIAAFCERNYGVTFPMFSKISVKGDDQDPLYAQLTSLPEPLGGEIRWNFDKFLVDRTGRVVNRFGPRTRPDDAELVAAIDELLASS